MPCSTPWITNRCRCSPSQPKAICNTVCTSATLASPGTSDPRQRADPVHSKGATRACSPTLDNGWGHRGINRGKSESLKKDAHEFEHGFAVSTETTQQSRRPPHHPRSQRHLPPDRRQCRPGRPNHRPHPSPPPSSAAAPTSSSSLSCSATPDSTPSASTPRPTAPDQAKALELLLPTDR